MKRKEKPYINCQSFLRPDREYIMYLSRFKLYRRTNNDLIINVYILTKQTLGNCYEQSWTNL